MHLQGLVGILALAKLAAAFSDSTPFVFLSTSSVDPTLETYKIYSSTSVSDLTKQALSTCPTEHYLIINQPGLNTRDLRGQNGCAMPHLCSAIENSNLKVRTTVAEVVGSLDQSEIARYIERACAKSTKSVTVKELNLSSMSSEDAAGVLAGNDASIANDLDTIAKTNSYTIMLLSTPAESSYEAEFEETVGMELKRDVKMTTGRRQGNETEWNKLPLFEKYQFFTPGIFMAIITVIVLLSILYVGLGALSSLEVSYGAFEKDMGPAAQKKQQ